MEYLTIRLPKAGELSGCCSTVRRTADSPRAAAEDALRKADDGAVVLVVEGNEGEYSSFTHAFRKSAPVVTVERA